MAATLGALALALVGDATYDVVRGKEAAFPLYVPLALMTPQRDLVDLT
jgi:hypothetical protein